MRLCFLQNSEPGNALPTKFFLLYVTGPQMNYKVTLQKSQKKVQLA